MADTIIYQCPAAPATPAAPLFVSRSCTASSVTLQTPAWPTDNDTINNPVRSIELWRVPSGGDVTTGGVLVGSFGNSGATLVDAAVMTPNSYDYYAKAVNETGDSAFSAALTVSMASPLTVSFIGDVSTQETALRGIVELVVQVSGNGATLSTLAIEKDGNALAGVARSVNPAIWSVFYDTDADDFQGDVTFTAWLKDTGGCESVRAVLVRNLNNTLTSDVSYLDAYLGATGGLEAVQFQALCDAFTDRHDYDYEARIIAPSPPSAPLSRAVDDALLPQLADEFESGIIGTRGSDTPLYPDESGAYPPSATLRFRRTRRDRSTLFSVAAPVLKLRPDTVKDGDKTTPRILAFCGARLYAYDGNGFALLRDDSALLPDATDGALRADKVFCVSAGRVVSVDVDSGDAAYAGAALGEIKPALFCDYLGGDADSVLLIYSDGSATTAYTQQADQVRKVFDVPHGATHLHAAGTRAALTCGALLYAWNFGDAAPLLRFTHSENITFARIEASGDLTFSDAAGRTYSLLAGATVAALMDDRAFAVNAFDSGTAPLLRALGGNAPQLYLERAVATNALQNGAPATLFAATQDFGAGASLTALQSFAETGGVASLLCGVTTPSGSFVARVQARPSPTNALRGGQNLRAAFGKTLPL